VPPASGTARKRIEKIMKKASCIAVVLGAGLMMMPCVMIAQTPANHAAAAPAAIPLDQQPTKEQLAKLFEVMRLREQMQNAMKMVPGMVQQQVQAQAKEMTAKLPGGAPTAEQQVAIEKVLNKYLEKAISVYSVDEMIDDMGTIYQHHLSRTDIDAFIAFYGSPAGQHLLDQQPAIMQEYMPMVMKRVQERSKVLTNELIKEMEEITKPQAPAAEKPAAK
jgi:uncharacterized protein